MVLNIDEQDLKQGVLSLVLALVEIIRDTLKLQAVKRMEGGGLTEEETERLGSALMELDLAIDRIKEEHGVSESVQSLREQLDGIVEGLVDERVHPEPWARPEKEPRDATRWS